MPEFSKAVRKHIRQIRDQAYQTELSKALRELESGFSDWHKGQIDSFQLTDLVHRFHQGPSRQLYNYYSGEKAHVAAARAIAFGMVPTEEVPAEVREALAREIQFHQQMGRDPE